VQLDPNATVVKVLTWAYLATMMFSLGLELGKQPEETKEAKRARRRMLVWAITFSVAVLPFVAVVVLRWFSRLGGAADAPPTPVITALALLISVPGGRFAPQLARLARGAADLALSTELTLFLAKLTPITSPLSARLALGLGALHLREWPFLLELLVLQVAPLYVGKRLRQKRPAWAAAVTPATNVFVIVTTVALLAIAFGSAGPDLVHLAGDRGWPAVVVVCGLSPILGWMAGGTDRAVRHALSIQSNARELALALALGGFASSDARVRAAIFAVWLVSVCAALLVTLAMSPHVRDDFRQPETR
jgi:predicted Na+-dependent transporter